MLVLSIMADGSKRQREFEDEGYTTEELTEWVTTHACKGETVWLIKNDRVVFTYTGDGARTTLNLSEEESQKKFVRICEKYRQGGTLTEEEALWLLENGREA